MKQDDFQLPDAVITALTLLEKAGREAFVVGGAVRSHLLGLPIHDYDLATDAVPEEILRIFRAFPHHAQGLRHGTVTVLFPHMPVEITTYRTESVYPDHRHPASVTFTRDLKQDCSRRDFTINALCYHPAHGYIDYFHGLADIRAKKIRTVGNPERRFEEDALRILRALRFASVYGFTIVEETEKAMYEKRDALRYISAERIHDEWVRTLKGAAFPSVFFSYRAIFAVFFAELETIQNDSLLRHALKAASLQKGDAVVLSAILFACMDTPDIAAILTRLKFAVKDRRIIGALYALRNAPIATRADLLHILQQAASFLPKFILFYEALHPSVHGLEKRLLQLQTQGAVYTVAALAVNGQDLLDMQIPARLRGALLNRVLEEVIRGRLANEKAEQLAFIRAQVPPDRHS